MAHAGGSPRDSSGRWAASPLGINLVVRSDAREFLKVMNVDEPGNYLPVPGHEVKAADIADRSE